MRRCRWTPTGTAIIAFEWTRAQFAAWASSVAARFGYTVSLRGVGDDDPELGTPTQLALFTKDVAK